MKKQKEKIENISPIDGDMLTKKDGEIGMEKGVEFLRIRVIFIGRVKGKYRVNGKEAKAVERVREKTSLFEAYVNLYDYRNNIRIEESNLTNTIVVYWLKEIDKQYRLSTDDNIRFLKDLTENNYKSIFENPYLNIFKEANIKYGSKVHFNLFYQDQTFNLSQMTDRYKEEWKANSDWIQLSFHSRGEFPDKPYEKSSYREMQEDYKLVAKEIIRFAGKELLSPITTIHWGAATREGVRALKDSGVKGLVGFFKYDEEGRDQVSYYLDKEQIDHFSKRDIWKDNREDIIFIKSNIVLDRVELEEIESYLNKSNGKDLIEILIHEQYFYKDYIGYQADYKEKIMEALEYLHENAYRASLWRQEVLE